MKSFTLHHLVGPGKSLDENFELLHLHLAKADLPDSDVFRISPPDGGIDIYCRSNKGRSNLAIQVKAYPAFRPDLLTAIERSVRQAVLSSKDYPWDQFILSIPFVPTAAQRKQIEAVFKNSNPNRDETITILADDWLGKFHICDGDELEAELFRHQDIANRFFPQILIASPYEPSGFILGFAGGTELLDLHLTIDTWGQRIPLRVSPDAHIGSLINLLIGQLKLPYEGTINSIRSVKYEITWQLWLRVPDQRVLDSNKTFREEKVAAHSSLGFKMHFRILTETQQFAFNNFKGNLTIRRKHIALRSYFDSTFVDLGDDQRNYEEMLCAQVYSDIKMPASSNSAPQVRSNGFENKVIAIVEKMLASTLLTQLPCSFLLSLGNASSPKSWTGETMPCFSIQARLPSSNNLLHMWVWGCKDFETTLKLNEIQEFEAKLHELSEGEVSGTIVSASPLEADAFQYAKTKNIGIIRMLPPGFFSYSSLSDQRWEPCADLATYESAITSPSFHGVNQEVFGIINGKMIASVTGIEKFSVLNLCSITISSIEKTVNDQKRAEMLYKAYCARGNCWAELGAQTNALKDLSEAQAISPDYLLDGTLRLGEMLERFGKVEDALAAFEKCLAMTSDSDRLCYKLGSCLQRLGRLDDALEMYERALSRNPNHADSKKKQREVFQRLGPAGLANYYTKRAEKSWEQGKREDAFYALQLAMEVKPDSPAPLLRRAAFFTELGLKDEATASFRSVLQIDPQNKDALRELARLG
jgi:Tfp pilus assembly protein PilF